MVFLIVNLAVLRSNIRVIGLGVIGAPLPPQVEEPKVSVSSEPDSFSDEQSTDSISPRFALLNKLDWMYQQDVDGDTSKSQRWVLL